MTDALLPTPTLGGYDVSAERAAERAAERGIDTLSLSEHVALLPTPAVNDMGAGKTPPNGTSGPTA